MPGKYQISTRWPQVFLFQVALLLSLASCRNEQPVKKEIEPSALKESLIQANKEAVGTEAGQIEDFLRRYEWDVTETGTGLRYWIYRHGSGERAERGDLVEMKYVISLLSGDTAYTSEERGTLVFYTGKAQVITGLEEGILLLGEGDRAKFIIPSHLAYGLIGDQDRIGKKTTLVYDVEVLKINKKH